MHITLTTSQHMPDLMCCCQFEYYRNIMKEKGGIMAQRESARSNNENWWKLALALHNGSQLLTHSLMYLQDLQTTYHKTLS